MSQPRRIDQTQFGVRGNCQSACLAMLLGLPLEQVPNFLETPGADRDDAISFNAQRAWLRERGWTIITLSTKATGIRYLTRGYAIAGGMSPRGHPHSVIINDAEIWHDPHPDRTGLVEITELDLLIPLNPAALSDSFGQEATKVLAEVRRRLIAWLDEHEAGEERVRAAASSPILGVLADVLIDAHNFRVLADSAGIDAERAIRRAGKAEEDLAEAKRPFTAQMEMQNKRITGLNARVDQLEIELRKAQNQRDDFRRQLTAEREGRMAAERIVDEVRARNRELEADAARWRWWRRWYMDDEDDMERINGLVLGAGEESLDQAVDEAIAAAGKPNG